MATATEVFQQSNNGIAKALLARIYRNGKKNTEAYNTLNSIKERWLQLHPQVVVDRDKVLRALGPDRIAERKSWLDKVDALPDEWVIERRIQLLIDMAEVAAAKKLLLDTRWQKVHQTYTRTGLWEQICEAEGNKNCRLPVQLGEDRLARFGAYREYE